MDGRTQGTHRRQAGSLHKDSPDAARLGAAVILSAALLHAATMFSPLPWWDMSPLVVSPSMSGMGPAQALVTDVVMLIGAVLVFVGEARRGARVHGAALALAALGVVGVVLHGWVLPTRGLANQQLGSTWAAAVIAMVAMLHACRDERTRRLCVAVVLGFIALLAIKGAQQTFIEHPRTVANFEADRDQILAAQGWSPDSPMARGYERRLRQPDPSAWFGLSNVYASFMAAGAAAFLAGLVVSLRGRDGAPKWALVVMGVGAAAGLGALGLTYSKGGLGALGLGVVVVGALVWVHRRGSRRQARAAGWLMLGAVAAPIVAVVVRGLIGERLGERSLLFRWFYWQGASRIATDHPVAGVGPAGFQEAYLSARPPLSVEEVTSPHGLPFDWWATLGLFGLAWVGLFGLVAWRIGSTSRLADLPTAEPMTVADPEADRQESRLAFLIAAVVAVLGTWLDMQVVLPHGPTVTLDRAGVWLAGLLAWWGVTAAGLRVGRAKPAVVAWAATAAAVVLAVHAQIEVTPVQASSAGLFFVLLGVAAAGGNEKGQGRGSRAAGVAAAVVVGVLAGLVASSAWRARVWQGGLREAAAVLAPVTDIRSRLTLPDSDPDAARHRREAMVDLSQLVGRPIDTPEPWLTLLQIDRIPAAVEAMEEAEGVFEDQWRLRRAAAWLLLDAAASLKQVDQPEARAEADRLIATAREKLEPEDGSGTPTGQLRAYASLLENVAGLTGIQEFLKEAAAAYEQVAASDPYNLPVSVKLARLHEELGDPQDAGAWARRALELDGLKRLDAAVHGLDEADREAMRRLAVP